ncbi:PREDICTED: uncharacterized protein LOC108378195 [Rhagoletis zephyria]|uniref:uncharacterized protein LOC108378195 n=1 Tax=Rhagoletis zephyria TaxID=28612 RepID=UPI000811A450|nr:PREDICTED: uncharacterized protein LOC108378195 [Rhagoletis zephyria]
MLPLEVNDFFFDNHLMFPAKRCEADWWVEQNLPLDAYHLAYLKPKKSAPVPVKPVTKVAPFTAKFDVSNFDPFEVSVKVDGKYLTVECTRERKADNGHFEYGHFVKKVPIPDDCLTEHMHCKLHQNGLLLIEAPQTQMEAQVETAKVDNISEEKMEVEVQTQSTEAEPVTEPPKLKESQPEVVIEDIGPEI